jgi:putative transposase
MVLSPGDYRWSSHQINTLGKTSDLYTPHPEYLMLGTDSKERCEKYLALFEHDIHEQGIDLIRKATKKGIVVGNDRFQDEIEALTGRRVREKKRGRCIGWQNPDV